MPVYLLHGFRWPRPLIRIHIILHNLEDAAAEWLVAPGTTETLLENFDEIFPDAMEHLPKLRFIEQYDPDNTSADAASQPYAYIADVVHNVQLGLDVDDVRGKGVSNEQWASLLEIRDKLAPEEKVGWFIVVCGDEERSYPSSEKASEEDEVAVSHEAMTKTAPAAPAVSSTLPSRPSENDQHGGHARNTSIGYPSRTESAATQERNNSRSARDSTSSAGYSHYDPSQRPRTAGSVYTSASSRTTRGTNSPDASRRDHVDLSRKEPWKHSDPQQKGFRKIISSLKRRKSRISIKEINPSRSSLDAPPVPALPQRAK